jgi:hypothetical protein
MKSYELDTEFTFGKYKGKTVRQMLDLQPTYIDWCSINLDHFHIAENIIEEIRNIKPDFLISTEGQKKLKEKSAIEAIRKKYSGNYNDNRSNKDETDWSHYNDNLDMDQQGIEFWNQF